MITVFGSVGMDLLFGLPHLPAIGAGCALSAAPERMVSAPRYAGYSAPKASI